VGTTQLIGYLVAKVILANGLVAGSFLPDGDLVALSSFSRDSLFHFDSNRTIQSWEMSSSELNADLSALSLSSPYRRLAGTTKTDRGYPVGEEIYLYYQLNGTHLAEISRNGSYWRHNLIYVPSR
jgi:hypothetical protein